MTTLLCTYIAITDIDECLDNNGNCSNDCVNTEGSYYCKCPAGYHLQPNNRICKGKHSYVTVNCYNYNY